MLQIYKIFQMPMNLQEAFRFKKQHVYDSTVRTWSVERFKAVTSIIVDKIQDFQCFLLIYCALNTTSTSLNRFCEVNVIQTQSICKNCVKKQQIILA